MLRSLQRGIGRADPAVAAEIEAKPDVFVPIPWNPLYYQGYKPLDEDLPWIDALLKQDGPTREDVREALSWRRRFAWLMVAAADLFHFLIPLLPDPAVKNTIRETQRYFSDDGGIGEQVRELLKAPLRRMLAGGDRILIIAHSMGSVITYDALWELKHIEKNPGARRSLPPIQIHLRVRRVANVPLAWISQQIPFSSRLTKNLLAHDQRI